MLTFMSCIGFEPYFSRKSRIFYAVGLVAASILAIVLFFVKKNVASKNDKVKEIAVKYELSIQEEKVLGYLIQYMKKTP